MVVRVTVQLWSCILSPAGNRVRKVRKVRGHESVCGYMSTGTLSPSIIFHLTKCCDGLIIQHIKHLEPSHLNFAVHETHLFRFVSIVDVNTQANNHQTIGGFHDVLVLFCEH